MAVFLVSLVLFLALTGQSSATYCVCKDGVSASALQKNIDYACGAGADCTAILQNGACYNPNTLKDHCNYAVNSYFQRKGQAVGSCDFAGTAITTQTISAQASSCVYPASPSTAGSSTTPSTGTGTTSNTPSSSTGLAGGTTTTTPSSVFGLGPTGSGGINKATITLHHSRHLFWCSLSLTFLFLGSSTLFRL